MAHTSRDDVNRDAGIEQQRFVRTAEIVEPKRRETELPRAPPKSLVRPRAPMPPSASRDGTPLPQLIEAVSPEESDREPAAQRPQHGRREVP
jgi:hypothetical protein